MKPQAAYRRLHASGELAARAANAREHLASCDLCARHCGVDRTTSAKGAACRTGDTAVVASFGAHHGEEDPLRGTRGSGTIFFSWCNLHCVFCQNADISHAGQGRPCSDRHLADIMLGLQRRGCHNINLVSPSHVVAQCISAIALAAEDGLEVPIVYNTGGCDSPEALELLDGVIDIYMPDMKYGDSAIAARYSRIKDYVAINQAAVREMHRQVGDLVLDDEGVARRGLLVRHLVLPEGLAGTAEVARFLAEEISPETYLNLMDQYRPCYHAPDHPPISRGLTYSEFLAAVDVAHGHGLARLDHEMRRSSFSLL